MLGETSPIAHAPLENGNGSLAQGSNLQQSFGGDSQPLSDFPSGDDLIGLSFSGLTPGSSPQPESESAVDNASVVLQPQKLQTSPDQLCSNHANEDCTERTPDTPEPANFKEGNVQDKAPTSPRVDSAAVKSASTSSTVAVDFSPTPHKPIDVDGSQKNKAFHSLTTISAVKAVDKASSTPTLNTSVDRKITSSDVDGAALLFGRSNSAAVSLGVTYAAVHDGGQQVAQRSVMVGNNKERKAGTPKLTIEIPVGRCDTATFGAAETFDCDPCFNIQQHASSAGVSDIANGGDSVHGALTMDKILVSSNEPINGTRKAHVSIDNNDDEEQHDQQFEDALESGSMGAADDFEPCASTESKRAIDEVGFDEGPASPQRKKRSKSGHNPKKREAEEGPSQQPTLKRT